MNLPRPFGVKRVPPSSTRGRYIMSKSLWPLAVLVALGAATPALAQYGEDDAPYPSDYFSGFQYRPFHVQIEGGPTLPEGKAGHDLDSAANIGLGLTWQPTSILPLAVR